MILPFRKVKTANGTITVTLDKRRAQAFNWEGAVFTQDFPDPDTIILRRAKGMTIETKAERKKKIEDMLKQKEEWRKKNDAKN